MLPFELPRLLPVLALLLDGVVSGTLDEPKLFEVLGEVVMLPFPPHAVSNITRRIAIAVIIASDFFIISTLLVCQTEYGITVQ